MQMIRYSYIGSLARQDFNRVEAIGEAGRRNDQSQVEAIVEILKAPPHPTFVTNGLHALGQMGAIEALPTIEAYFGDEPASDRSNLARVVKARVLAEESVRHLPGGENAAAVKVRTFFRELGLTCADLSTKPLRYLPTYTAHDEQGKPKTALGVVQITSVEAYALRELADMVYHGVYQDYASLPGIAQVDFGRDPLAALKMRLAPLTREERLRVMVEELSHKQVLRGEDYPEMQLLINEGRDASAAIAAKLRAMDAHPDGYDPIGFDALCEVLAGLGDKGALPLVENSKHFHTLSHIHNSIARGTRCDKVLGY